MDVTVTEHESAVGVERAIVVELSNTVVVVKRASAVEPNTAVVIQRNVALAV